MPRGARGFVDGAVYHVVNRVGGLALLIEQYILENNRPPTPQEINQHRKGNASVALSPEVHAHTDTFRGRNTGSKSTADALDLDSAAQRGADDVINAGNAEGVDLSAASERLLELHRQRMTK